MSNINKHIGLRPDNYEYVMNRINKKYPRRNGHRLLSAELNLIIDGVREAENGTTDNNSSTRDNSQVDTRRR